MNSINRKNGLLLLILVVGVLIYSLSGNSIGIHPDFGEESLTVSASDLDWVIPYDQIAAIELTELNDTGMMSEGVNKKNLQCGTWTNDLWGEYTLCVNPKLSQCIVLTQKNGSIFVLNYESDESTAALCDMFTELLESKHIPA